MLDEKTKELVAIGATITVNCQPCLEYHTSKARQLGATPDEILAAVEAGKEVRAGAAAKMDRFAAGFLNATTPAAKTAGCGCGA
jgi:AhpD family alkylhydroperoxidase